MDGGHDAGEVPSAADLVQARDRLLKPVAGQRRLTPDALREALTDLHEFWLTAHAAQAGIGVDQGVALVAVGGLGRRELVPYADLDLLLVHEGRGGAVPDLAERLWYPLWNSGIGLDHSVRTVGEALDVAASDLRTAVGLLDARLIAGDPQVADRLATSARDRWRTSARKRVPALAEDAKARWQRSGEVAHWVEPDLKHGRGGLRDIGLLRALAVAQLIDRPSDELHQAHRLLLDVRTEFRRIVRRANDVLRAQDADEVAAALDKGDRFDLARALSGAGRTVAYALDVAIRTVASDGPRRVLGRLRRGPERRPLDEGVVLHGNEVALARDAEPHRDPALLLRVAAAAARTGHPISPATLQRLAETAPEPRAPWPVQARDELIALLGTGEGLIDVIEALDRTGLWARLFPEWGAVRDLPPRDAAHKWTVDRHLVQATAHASRMVTRVARPDLLLLGALLHDIGKGRRADHSEVGAALANQVGERLGLSKGDVDVLAAMVRHHLLLPDTATRRDVTDETTIMRVAETLGGDPVLLELLHALAEADSLATGPGVWTDWKAALIGDLVANSRRAMAGEPIHRPDPLDPTQRVRAEAVAASGKHDVDVEASGRMVTVTVFAPDRPGLLSRAAGVLALNSLEVHAASVDSYAGIAVDVFTASPRFGSLPAESLLREQMGLALSGNLPLAERLAAKERDYGGRPDDAPEPRVLWFDEAGKDNPSAVVLELRAVDRIGLLYRVAEALERCGADVLWARAATLGATAVDSFCVKAADGGPLSAASREKLAEAVRLAAIT
ncbi:[protein-PII] uridylyltransferase [Kibdelosporangium persicum]|uniref:Bifunctional uridylyltransferase/uridylyl-removing enzyme n=1 Tax=Kibdelosporangium persicum TaxID=2698649 RepID=A0ABX2FF17_9PSEU|nr:[protein-PII] uridylyltransferase [Kibdelosporangium persicum]NRN69330.1 Bifunctional uridylyltransferase/uridylyl-removing enzyme [Kibdelosporangium persicum]